MNDFELKKEESRKAISDLRDIKSSLIGDLEDIKVRYNEDDNPQIVRSIKQIFGEMKENDLRKGYITFDMYIESLRIIKAAGKAKAGSILDKGFS